MYLYLIMTPWWVQCFIILLELSKFSEFYQEFYSKNLITIETIYAGSRFKIFQVAKTMNRKREKPDGYSLKIGYQVTESWKDWLIKNLNDRDTFKLAVMNFHQNFQIFSQVFILVSNHDFSNVFDIDQPACTFFSLWNFLSLSDDLYYAFLSHSVVLMWLSMQQKQTFDRIQTNFSAQQL